MEAQFTPGLKALGFKKKARTWTRETEEAFQLVNLQKSSYGEQVYVNVAVYLKALGEETFPPERRCHIRARLERIAPENLFENISTLNAQLPPHPGLLIALLHHAIPWLELVSSRIGLRSFIGSPAAKHCFITSSAHREFARGDA